MRYNSEYQFSIEIYKDGAIVDAFFDPAKLQFKNSSEGVKVLTFSLPKHHRSISIMQDNTPPIVNAVFVPPHNTLRGSFEYSFSGLVTERFFDNLKQEYVYVCVDPTYILQNTFVAYLAGIPLKTSFKSKRYGQIINLLLEANTNPSLAVTGNFRYTDYDNVRIRSQISEVGGAEGNLDVSDQSLYTVISQLLLAEGKGFRFEYAPSGSTDIWDLYEVDNIEANIDFPAALKEVPHFFMEDSAFYGNVYKDEALSKKSLFMIRDNQTRRHTSEVYVDDAGSSYLKHNEMVIKSGQEFDTNTFNQLAKKAQNQNLKKFRQTYQIAQLPQSTIVQDKDAYTPAHHTYNSEIGQSIIMVREGTDLTPRVFDTEIIFDGNTTVTRITVNYGFVQ